MLEKPKLDHLASAEEKLYSPEAKFDVRPRRYLKEKRVNAPQSWGNEAAEGVSSDQFVASLRQTPSSPFAKIFVGAFLFFLIAAGYGFWKLGPGAPGNAEGTEDIRLSVVAPSVAAGGEEYAFDVVIQNLSPIGIRLVDLVVEMPPGTRDAETLREDLPRLRIPLGDIAAGETRRQTVAVALFGDQGERRSFDIRLEYRAPNSATIFEKERSYEVALGAAPVLLTVDALSEITPGQPLVFVAKVTSNSTSPLGPVGLEVSLPFGFTVSKLSEAPREENFWVFDKLSPGETREVRITGVIDGAHGDDRIFRFVAGSLDSATSTAVAVPYGSRAVQVAVTRPFLDLILTLDDEESAEAVRTSRSRIAANLAVVNNTTGPIRDVIVDVTLTGLALDERAVQVSDGVFRSADNVAHWDKTTNQSLEEIAPGQAAYLSLSFQALPLAENGRVFENPEIVVDIEANGQRVYDENVPEELVSELVKRVKILSDVDVETTLRHLAGPNPPKVDTESVFRVGWALSNSSNKIESGKVSAVLGPLLEWKGKATSEDITFDPNTRLVTWNVGTALSGVGFGRPVREASFDVGVVPSVLYEGEVAPMLGPIKFSGADTFTGTDIGWEGEDLSTASIPENDGKVAP